MWRSRSLFYESLKTACGQPSERSVLCCVWQLYTVICTHVQAVFKAECWFRFRFSFCLDLAFLFRPWERLRSIVMNMSVCKSVCLSVRPQGYLQNHTRDLYQIFCACCVCPWLGPPPLFDDRPHRLWVGSGWRKCTVQTKCICVCLVVLVVAAWYAEIRFLSVCWSGFQRNQWSSAADIS